MASFHGNFFVRSTDLLAMPAVPQDQSYAIEIQIEETITAPFVVFQTAVLHTTCYGQSLSSPLHPSQSKADSPWLIGERRIRVITLALPVTTNLSEVFASADQVAIATLLANKAVERSLTHKLEDARDAVLQKVVDMLQSYKANLTAAGAGASAQLATSENLKMLPVLTLGLLKNVGSPPFTQRKISMLTYVIGWYSPKCPDSSRSSCIRSGPSDFSAFATLDPLHPSYVLLLA
jgi:protein transport protein SEC24